MKLILIIVAVIVAYLVWYKMVYKKKGSPLLAEQAEFEKIFRAGDRSGSLALMNKIKEEHGIAPFPVDISVPPANMEFVWEPCGADQTIDQCFENFQRRS